MRKFFTIILFCLSFLLVSCSSNTEKSFTRLSGDADYSKSLAITDKNIDISLSLDELDDICGTNIFTDDLGYIILKEAELISPDTLNLYFEAHGVINDDTATLLTASAYDDGGFLKSDLSTTTSDDIIVLYSLQSSVFEDFGNKFSVTIFQSDQNKDIPPNIRLNISDLILVSFQKPKIITHNN